MEWFSELQAAQQAEFRDWLPERAAWLRELNAVYLYGTIGSEAVLLADGTVRIWVAEAWPESEEITERVATHGERIGALVIGAQKYPALRQLLPKRLPSAPTCAACRGSGYVGSTGVICAECNGLGWIAQAT